MNLCRYDLYDMVAANRLESKFMICFRVALILLTLFLSTSALRAEKETEEWELIKEDEVHGITVYYRTLSTGNVEFKGVTYINCSLNSCVALFSDVDTMPEWAYRTEKVVRLKEISDREVYAYTIHTMPFPFEKRDSIVHSFLEQDPKTLAVTIRGKGEPTFIPRKEGFVRITAIESFWKFTPQKDGSVEVVFQGFGEPGGSIPSSIYRSAIFRWLCRFFLWELPFSTLENMKTVIKRKKYQTKTFNYIKEPLRK